MPTDDPCPDLGLLYFTTTDAEFAAMEAEAEAKDRRSGGPFLYSRKASSRTAKRLFPKDEQLAKITEGEDMLRRVVRSIEEEETENAASIQGYRDALQSLATMARQAL